MRLYLQCLLILKCLGIVVSFCVLDKKKGWWLDCGIRDSYLLRLKDFGGLQANFNIGFGLGDEKGFPNSITKTTYKGKRGHHPPPPEYAPAPAPYSGHRRNEIINNPNRRSDFPYEFDVPSAHPKPPPPPQQNRIWSSRLPASRENGQSWSQISHRTANQPKESRQNLQSYQTTQQNQRQPVVDHQRSQTGYEQQSQSGNSGLKTAKQTLGPNPGPSTHYGSLKRNASPQPSQNPLWLPTQGSQTSQQSQKQDPRQWSDVSQKSQRDIWSQTLPGTQNVVSPSGNPNLWSHSQQQSSSYRTNPQPNPTSESQAQRRYQYVNADDNSLRNFNPSTRIIPPPPAFPVPPPEPPVPPHTYSSNFHHPNYEIYDQDNISRDFQVFHVPHVTTSSTPTIGPDMAELLKLPSETLASSDDVPSFAAKKFVVREAPVEFYPPNYPLENAINKPKLQVEIPRTNFYCEEQKFSPGIYADAKLGCKMFHLCVPSSIGSSLTSYLCPNGSLFDQSILQCNYWYTVDCESSINDYDANLALALSYRRINAAHLPLSGATDLINLSLLSQNVNQYQLSKRAGKALVNRKIYPEVMQNSNDTEWSTVDSVRNASKDVTSTFPVSSPINSFVPSSEDSFISSSEDSWIPILRESHVPKKLLKFETKRHNKDNKKKLGPLNNSLESEPDEELLELIVEIQTEFKLKKFSVTEGGVTEVERDVDTLNAK